MKRNFLFLCLSVLFVGASCTDLEEPVLQQENEEGAFVATQTRSSTTVFETLENPYTLERMRRISGNPTLQSTNLYVRFLPQDSTQLNTLEDFYQLDLFDYPLDINIEDDEVYVDPTIPGGEFTWQYTVVPANFVFPAGIQKQVLQQCYIPADDELLPPGTRAGEMTLEEAAILDCGYIIPPQTRASGRPDGRVTVFDDVKNKYVPVKGVRVKCHYFLKIAKCYTDTNGDYSISTKFYVKPHYVVVFKNSMGFILWDWLGARAKYRVKNRQSPSGYDIIINNGDGEEWQRSVINNAAYEYYRMCEITGIRKPPSGLRVWVQPNATKSSAPMLRRIGIGGVLTKDNWATYLGWGTGLVIPVSILEGIFKFLEPDLTIGTKNKNYRNIYEVVNHELSHASHFSQVGVNYWTKYASYIVQHTGYGNGTGSYAGNCQIGEMWAYAMEEIQGSEWYNDTFRLSNSYPYLPIDGWIQPDPIWALITRGVLTKKQVFDCLTSDVDTRDKLINKLCAGKSAAITKQITTAFSHNDVATITGQDNVVINTSASYSFPTSLASGFTFTGWTVTPGTNGVNWQAGSMNANPLQITFKAYATYTLTAKFTLPGGVPYSVAKTIVVQPALAPPNIFPSALIIVDKIGTLTASHNQQGVSYFWEQNGSVRFGDSTLTFFPSGGRLPPLDGVNSINLRTTVRCRVQYNGEVSGWSEPAYVYYESTIGRQNIE